MFHVPNKYRDTITPHLKSNDSYGNNGFFIIPHYKVIDYQFRVQASDGMGWEHVSISVGRIGEKQTRTPTWQEMCWIKNMFWTEHDCVIQYHPAASEYINMHPFVLHLWRPTHQEIPIPQKEMIGMNITDYRK